jgi:hypothetical protein
LSLIAFHRFLIAAGIVFCFGFAGWEVHAFLNEGAVGSILLALVFIVLGVGLSIYLWRLKRILGYER